MELRGDNLRAAQATDHDWVLSGPRDTGKTVACCYKGHMFGVSAPRCRGLIVRKTQASMAASVLKTFEQVAAGSGVRVLGGNSPTLYEYPNGSTVRVCGMDNASKILSSEWDWVYVNQAEETSEGDWEFLSGSCSGRGAVVAHPQCFGDCNPAGSRHWIRERAKAGALRLFAATHADNPQLFDAAGKVLEGPDAARRLAILAAYTGIRRKRMFEGLWVTAEGAVYDNFDASVHVRPRDPREMVRWFLAQDDGYTHPAVILLVGADGDGRWHVFREWYRTGQIHSQVIEVAREWFLKPAIAAGLAPDPEPTPEETKAGKKRQWLPCCDLDACDEAAAALIAALKDAGVRAIGGKGKIVEGCNPIRDRLAPAGDGKPRLTVDPSCEETINEFESYVFEEGTDQPRDQDNHCMDAIRYLGHVLGERGGGFTAQSIKGVTLGSNPTRAGAAPTGPRRWTPRQWAGR